MHVTIVDQVVSKCWNKKNVTSRVASTLGRLAIFALRDEVTRVIIVLFVVGNICYKCRAKQSAHHRISSSQECRRLVLCAASLAISLFVPLL